MAKRATPAERRYLEGARSRDLAKLRRAYREQIIAQVSRLSSAQISMANGLDHRIASALVYGNDGMLTAASRRRVEAMVSRMVDQALDRFASLLGKTVDKGTRATAEATAAYLRKHGLTVSVKQAREIADRIAAKDVRFHGATVARRIQRIGKDQIARVGTALDVSKDAERTRSKILARTADPIGGPKTPGGSMLKEMTRVFVVEAFRKAEEVDLAVMTSAGVGFAWRRLSDLHKFTERSEVCEELNVEVYPGIRKLLRDAGIDPSDVDTRGLYPVDDPPDFPHPSCLCWWEPLTV